uniref:Uncharacterized protein n=1 Tax=Globodera pallida TaxID=36090 RepID=A0A183BV68_GLOPA
MKCARVDRTDIQ